MDNSLAQMEKVYFSISGLNSSQYDLQAHNYTGKGAVCKPSSANVRIWLFLDLCDRCFSLWGISIETYPQD